ncbi:cytochrome oxidase Cu insertion factor (SCO1/SenC/PrrC family) [Haloferula luteola]|uniref:Cytochrome oxidase Cu insertion factor (SCO1/SenC/PrrC family) n=1 Tax=Haloferula luteola TaxID=595692 RepID=A0A840V5P1_9BACT|nr:SCO family protein [Haloferula luteola]MBB5352346.1 cytochrome oxidase Cu insertion factor (SCO1/SenC/PrrC family) [Haloferula luteola]
MKGKIVIIYGLVAVVSVGLLIFFMRVANAVPESELPPAKDVGAAKVETFFPIEENFEMVRQDGEKVSIEDLRGKVTVLTEFFAVCPHCAVRNGSELRELVKLYGDDADFRLVCISVDPETDGLEELKAYGEVLGAKPEQWWFASGGETAATHRYLEEVLRFFKIRERKDPLDIQSNGRYAHDLGLLLIDRDLNVVGKWPLADARSEEGRSRDPQLYERLKEDLHQHIEKQLDHERAQ